jgi:outer membrane protein assembly factor BamB
MARGRWRAGALALAVLAAGAAPGLAAELGAHPPGEVSGAHDGCAWPMYGRDPGRSFAQSRECSALSPLTAPTLRVKWVFPTADSVTASPAVVGDTVYVGSWDGTFYALPTDPPPGPVVPRWTFAIDDTNNVAFGRIVSSAAVADVGGTRVVLFGGGATLYALRAVDGALLAKLCLDPREETDPPRRCRGSEHDVEIESSPAVVPAPDGDGWFVLVGTDVHNARNVGRTGVVAARLRADPWALEPVWKFDPETRRTYTGEGLLTEGSGTGDGCGSVWSSPAVDVTEGLVYFGTGSCHTVGLGEESVYAVDLASGDLVWWYSAPRDGRYDDDFGASPNLLPGGLVGVGSKDGWYYRFHRRPAAGVDPLAGRTRAGQSGHLTGGFAVGGMIGSAAVGEAGGLPAVFATTAIPTPVGRPLDSGAPSLDHTLVEDPGRLASLHAIAVPDGRILWRAPLARPSYGAASYVNGVVLVPSTFDFSLKAFDAATGTLLWATPLNGAPSSTPVPVGRSVYLGTGTRTTDAEYKLTDGQTVSPLSPLSGVWAFEVVFP